MNAPYEPEPTLRNDIRRTFEARMPVLLTATDDAAPRVMEGAGLCLSGGGYRAMLFHLGALWRLNELGLLYTLRRISSVSGGSITAARLGLVWNELGWSEENVATRFQELVADPICNLASRSIDVRSILIGLPPFYRTGKRLAKVYAKHLFGKATLQDLPAESEGPRFVINATNLRTGVLWRFSRPYMADYTVGLIRNPTTPLATAVAASAAFPPVLSPIVIKTANMAWDENDKTAPINRDLRDRAVLTDGGVYDNMGLETVFKKFSDVLVSDAGGGGGWSNRRAGATWMHQFWRVFWIQRYQVGRIRRRQLIESYKRDDGGMSGRNGAYWGIGTDIANYQLPTALSAPFETTTRLRDEPTRLKKLPQVTQRRIVNWGYAACDAAIRRHYATDLPAASGFPFTTEGVG